MPKSDKDYDPLRVMREATQKRDANDETVDQARILYLDWVRAWGFTTASVETLLGAGEILRKKEGVFWLNYVGCELGCRKRVSDLGLLPSVADDVHFAAEVLALKILLSAVAGETAVLSRQLEAVTQADQLDGVSAAVRSIRDRLQIWCFDRGDPPSPWITAEELSRACRGRMNGFSAANISKSLGGQLSAEASLRKKEQFRLFRHATQHREMLERVVSHLKKSEFLSFIFSDEKAGKTGRSAG